MAHKFEARDCGYETLCWVWVAQVDRQGYGRHARAGAHRAVYEMCVGPIPPGLELDHLCSNRSCVNPAHLEAVTHAENMARTRRTHCAYGHPFDDVNTYVKANGCRSCRACNREAARDYQRRQRSAAA